MYTVQTLKNIGPSMEITQIYRVCLTLRTKQIPFSYLYPIVFPSIFCLLAAVGVLFGGCHVTLDR
jgi:hypothetical protein